MLKGLFQHFLILKFLLIFFIPEAHICASMHTATPPITNMFEFWAYFKFPGFILDTLDFPPIKNTVTLAYSI